MIVIAHLLDASGASCIGAAFDFFGSDTVVLSVPLLAWFEGS